jgi:hypothetical protein
MAVVERHRITGVAGEEIVDRVHRQGILRCAAVGC